MDTYICRGLLDAVVVTVDGGGDTVDCSGGCGKGLARGDRFGRERASKVCVYT